SGALIFRRIKQKKISLFCTIISIYFSGCHLFHSKVQRVKPHHQIMELLFREIGCLLCIPWPGHPPVFESFIQKQESCPHPKQTFTSVRPLAAEEEKCPFFKWILPILIPDDHCQPINSLPEVNCSAGKDHTPDPCRILKHWLPPAGSCSEEIRKSGLRFLYSLQKSG